MSDLIDGELIRKLEAASEGSRELSAAIGLAIGTLQMGQYWRYTESLDAALTLVPEGWTVARINQNDDKTWAAELREGYLTSYNRVIFGGERHRDPTPALALCIAALKARAAQKAT